MNENDYDRAERVAIKRLDPVGFLAWLLIGLAGDLLFRRWLETQGAPFPGEPDRRCDCVAELVSASGTQPPWALLIEPQGQWQGHFLTRACQYLFMLHEELRHGPYDTDRYLMAAGIVDLCERPLQRSLSWQPPGVSGVGLTVNVWMRHVYQESARETLDGIAAGKIALCILVWVPLMLGGDDPEVVERWKEIANTEADRLKRMQYAAPALVLAEKRDRQVLWQKALEGWNVIESPYLREIREEGRREEATAGLRASVLEVLELRFPSAIPTELANEVGNLSKVDQLKHWFRLAVTSPTLEGFRTAIRESVDAPTNGSAAK